MPPMDVPSASFKWSTPSPSVKSRCCAANHVKIAVAGKSHSQPVARLARRAVPDAIGHDDEIPLGIKQLPALEELAGEALAQKLSAAAGGAMQGSERRCAPDR